MAELLKDLYSKAFIKSLCCAVEKNYSSFDSVVFTKTVFSDEWASKELKARMRHVSTTLYECLPNNYEKSLRVLSKTSLQFDGLLHMVFPDYVEVYGLNDFDESVSALEYFTERSSSEFAVRPFIVKYPKQMMAQMLKWTESKNEHVRRLASEGCRPRLPWAMALPEFKKDPSVVVRLLERLKDDDSEYVRRSVANNLNDISKDHPDVLIEISSQWIGTDLNRNGIIKHACRTLLKAGDSRALALFDLPPPKHVVVIDFKVDESVKLGGRLGFSFVLKTNKPQLGKLRVEYAMYFLKGNGTLSKKVFKISESISGGQSKPVEKNYSFRPISTRKYYIGNHRLSIIVNGHELCSSSFSLIS